MINPLEPSFFYNSYSVPYNGFENNDLVLSILYSNENIILQYMVLKRKVKEEYMICGFDFINEKIIPVEIKHIGRVLKTLEEFLNSEYNNSNKIGIGFIGETIEHFSKEKIKNGVHSYKTLSILTSTQRNIISGSCEMVSNGHVIRPLKSSIVFSNQGLVFGKFEIDNNSGRIQALKKIHLSEDLVFRYLISDRCIESAGTIYELKKVSDEINIIISSFIHELSKKKMGLLEFQGSEPHSPLHALLRPTGYSNEQIKIEGFNSKYVPYLVIIPIEDLLLNSLEFGLGDVTFMSKEKAFEKYKGFEKKCNQLLSKVSTFAQTIVEHSNAYDAYLAGRKKVQDAIDMIILLSKNERVFNLYNLGDELNEWNRFRLYQNPQCSLFYYVEDILGLENLVGESNNTWENNSLIVDSNFKDLFRKINWYEEKLYKKQSEKYSAGEKQLFNALKWLNRSWKAEDIEDKVIYSNISMEFLVDKVETEPFLPKGIVQEFKKTLKQLLKEKSDIFTEEYSRKIKEKSLGKLNDPPLKVKVQTLIEQLGIPIDDEDFNKMWKVREYRNDLVHGKDELKIDPGNVLVANILLGEFIVYRLRSMKDGDKN